jgi:AraC-like DNA-binding protein
MDYQVYSPTASLSSFIKCFWSLSGESVAKPERQRIVPDGCMELIIHCGDLYCQYLDKDKFIIQPRSFIFGQITTPLEIEPTGKSDIIAARFQPEGLIPFLHNMAITDLENRAVPLPEIFGERATLLEKQVVASGNSLQRIELIETFLLSALSDPKVIDTITRSCVELILQTQGQVGMGQLAGQLQVNRRNLERRFNAAIGMSPKQLARVVRLQAALKMLEQGKFTSLTSLAYEHGYYDQAHFIKDFREFTGMSPKSFFAGNLALSALFIAAD